MFRNRRKVLKAGSFHLWWCCLRYLLRFAVFCHHLVSQVFLWNQNTHDELLETKEYDWYADVLSVCFLRGISFADNINKRLEASQFAIQA